MCNAGRLLGFIKKAAKLFNSAGTLDHRFDLLDRIVDTTETRAFRRPTINLPRAIPRVFQSRTYTRQPYVRTARLPSPGRHAHNHTERRAIDSTHFKLTVSLELPTSLPSECCARATGVLRD